MPEIREVQEWPGKLAENRRQHYLEVFEPSCRVEALFMLLHSAAFPCRMFVLYEGTVVLGGFKFHVRAPFQLWSPWSVTMFDFAILPEAQGKGAAKQLLEHAERVAQNTHRAQCKRGKPPWGQAMFLSSWPYPMGQFAGFLMSRGFVQYPFYAPRATDFEWVSAQVYDKPVHTYRKMVVAGGILSPEVIEELDILDARQRGIVLGGLKAKLGAYCEEGGKLSYRYDVCPICKDVGSTLENPKCEECYLKVGCKVPFNHGFRHDPEMGAYYFGEMLAHLEALDA